jgi:hypothetical protein
LAQLVSCPFPHISISPSSDLNRAILHLIPIGIVYKLIMEGLLTGSSQASVFRFHSQSFLFNTLSFISSGVFDGVGSAGVEQP